MEGALDPPTGTAQLVYAEPCEPNPADTPGAAGASPEIPNPPPPHDVGPADREAIDADAAVAAASDAARRALKLIVTLCPRAPAGYTAILALGADGCDPRFHSLTVADLAEALAAVQTLLAEAELRWTDTPRYPPPAARTATPVPRRAAPESGAGLPLADSADAPLPAPIPAPEASPGQMTLFG